jgi:integrase/recombinase XerD
MRAFFRFCEQAGWTQRNPAKSVKAPKVRPAPTMPFTAKEMKRILGACEKYSGKQERLKAFVLTMRYSGLRIGDTIALDKSRLKGSKLLLYTAKTGTPVYVPLPAATVEALKGLDMVCAYSR